MVMNQPMVMALSPQKNVSSRDVSLIIFSPETADRDRVTIESL